jgi:hypothetical protein
MASRAFLKMLSSACRICASSAFTCDSRGSIWTPTCVGRWQAGDPEILLGDRGKSVDLASHRTQKPLRFLPGMRELLLQEVHVQADARERIAHLVRDVRSHSADRRQTLGANELCVARGERIDHPLELERQPTELVVGRRLQTRSEVTPRDGGDALLEPGERHQQPARPPAHR